MKTFDVVIIGGGTAGLMLARELSKKKRKTLIVDRRNDLLDFSFNTLGSFIDLEEFDFTENVVAQKIDTLTIYSKHFKRKFKDDDGAYIIDKTNLHKEMIDAIDKKYVTTLTGINIQKISKDTNGQFTFITDKNGNEYSGKIFVDASGTNGVISKKVGLREEKINLATGVEYNVKYLGKPNESYFMVGNIYDGGYGWIFPLKNKRAIIGFGSFDNKVVKDLKNRLNMILELPKIKKIVVKDNEKIEGGSIPLTPVLDKFVINNLVCVGDSVSQVNPIVGEGYKFIFRAAIIASKAIDTSLEKNDLNCLLEYETTWRNTFLANYKRAKSSQEKAFRFSKNDNLFDLAILLSYFRSNARIKKSLSGEFYSVKT